MADELKVATLDLALSDLTQFYRKRGGGPLHGLERGVNLLLDERLDAMAEPYDATSRKPQAPSTTEPKRRPLFRSPDGRELDR